MEKEDLMKIIDLVFDTEILSPHRDQEIVEARMVFSKILIERGHTIVSIGNFLNRNHATIIYYRKQISAWIEQYPNIYSKYKYCKDAFIRNRSPIQISREKNIGEIVIGLRQEVDDLIKQKIELKERLSKYRRMDRIVNLLIERVEEGQEEEVYRKINAMLNR
jgi:hypothetical protein